MTVTTSAQPSERPVRSRPLGALPATLLGVALPALGRLALDPLAGVTPVVDTGSGPRAVSLLATAGAAFVASLGAVVLASVARRTGRPRLVFLGGALAVLLLSLTGPMAATSVGAGLALATLHVLTAVGVLPVLGARLPRSR